MLRAAVFVLASGFAITAALGQEPPGFTGRAAFYDVDYKGKTSSGEAYDPAKLTAAHKTLPLGTKLRIIDRKTGKSVIVTVNDRGPFNKKLDIDVSLAAARTLDMIKRGIIAVDVVQLAGGNAGELPQPATTKSK